MKGTLLLLFLFLFYFKCVFTTPTITASPSLIVDKENITVSWSGITSPYEFDAIALFVPNQLAQNLTYIFVNASSTYSKGYGTINFSLLNIRDTYQFRYCSIGPTGFDCDIISNNVTCKSEQPMQGHLAPTGDPTEMRLMWVSNAEAMPAVKYGLKSGDYHWTVTATTSTYSVNDLCWNSTGGEYAQQFFLNPGKIRNAVLTELKPRTRYYYIYGSDDAWSNEMTFMSAQTDENHDEVNIIAFGDSGVAECENIGWFIPHNYTGWCEPASGQTTQLIQKDLNKKNYDMLLHIGDISYAVGYAIRWEQFFDQMESIATSLPYLVGVGNHEYDYYGQPFSPEWANYNDDSRGECGVPYTARFMMPQNGNKNNWFSMDYPLVHILFFSTEHNFSVGSDQYKWIEQDLQSVDHEKKWIVVCGHRPMYTSNIAAETRLFGQNIAYQLESLFAKYHVDVGLWGHVHSYERTCPVLQGQCQGDLNNPGGPVHFVVGMAGQTFDTNWENQPAWSMFRASEYGYARLHIPDRKRFHFQYVTNQDGNVHDDVWIYYNN